MALPRAWTMTTLSTLSPWKISGGRSSSPTRGSLAPLGEKARNRRFVSGGGNTISHGKAGHWEIWQKISVVTMETLHNSTQSDTGRSYDSVRLIIAVIGNRNIVCIGGNYRHPLLCPSSTSHEEGCTACLCLWERARELVMVELLI